MRGHIRHSQEKQVEEVSDRPQGEHETKYVLPNLRAGAALKWLTARCRPDPEYPEGIVSSIYYDTRDWRFLNEKVNSDYFKTKARLRWYSDMDGKPLGNSFMEAKFRTGSRRRKVRVATTYTGSWLSTVPLNAPMLRSIPEILRPESVLLPAALLPAFVVRYRRHRFIEPTTGARIALDSDIAAPRTNPQMVARTSGSKLREAVFEFKGALTSLPGFLHQLTALGCHKTSFSKYSLCYVGITE